MKNNGIILAVAVLALTVGIWTKSLLSPQSLVQPSPLPEFSLPDVSGQTRAISEWRGTIRVINFWATWCPPCREEIPELMAVQRAYAAQGVVVIGIAVDDLNAVQRFLAETALTYPVLVAGDKGLALSRQLGNTVGAVPFTVIADRQGQIVYRHPGGLTQADLAPVIKPLVDAQP